MEARRELQLIPAVVQESPPYRHALPASLGVVASSTGTPPATLRGPMCDAVEDVEAAAQLRANLRDPMTTICSPDMDTPQLLQPHPDTVDANLIPRIGMTFKDVDDAYNFYKRYAYEVGFPVKRYREKTHCKWLNCSREGKCGSSAGDRPRVRRKQSGRTQCKAGIKLRKIYDDEKKEVISVRIELVNLEHNHEFITQETEKRHLRCNKTRDPELVDFVGAMHDSRVPQHCIVDMISDMHDGPENVPITAQDLRNMRAARRRESCANDVAKLLAFFTSCKKHNPQFFCDFQLDGDGKIVSIFWSHASMQGEYIDFGDAVTFDTTHRTNLYDKPLGMFVGANHHLQCTVFGFALLGDETVETFEWAFNAFKTCMGGDGPRVMLTDQDHAMPIALSRVFPATIHRLCLWHVQNRYMPFLNELYARFAEQDFKTRFQSIIHHPLTPTEFEAAWFMLLDDFHLHEDVRLRKLYDIRKDWIPAFFKHDFCGVMVSTQRSESMNKLVKGCHVDANTPLHVFAKQMMKMVHGRKMTESKEALLCKDQTTTNMLYMFEIRVARAYTRAVMHRFEESMKYATAYRIASDPDGGSNDWVVQHTKRSNKIVWGQHQFKVSADVDAGKYTCECKQWEHTGLLCVHLLKTFMHLQIEKIPKEYILERYTKSARQDVPFERTDKSCKGRDGVTKSYRQKMLLTKTMKVVRYASMSKGGYEKALEVLDELVVMLSRLEPDIVCDDGYTASDGEDNEEEGLAVGGPVYGDRTENTCTVVSDNVVAPEAQLRGGAVHVPAGGKDGSNTENMIGQQPYLYRSSGVRTYDVGMPSADTRKKLDFVKDGISLDRPNQSKPKGRTIKESEPRIIRLGAKGEKKKNRRCQTCGVADGHNSRTCLSLEENRVRLASLGNRKRGRPPGSRNKRTSDAPEWNETSTAKRHRLVVSSSDDSDGDHMIHGVSAE